MPSLLRRGGKIGGPAMLTFCVALCGAHGLPIGILTLLRLTQPGGEFMYSSISKRVQLLISDS